MTTTTCLTCSLTPNPGPHSCPNGPIPCRCGHFDRTRYHSCRQARALADFRTQLLDELLFDPQADDYDDEIAGPWCSYCDGLGHTAEAHEVGIDDGFEAWEAARCVG